MSTTEFSVDEFVVGFGENPTLQKIDQLKKSELIEVAKHHEVAVKVAMRKSEIRNRLVQYFVEEELLPESSLEGIVETQSMLEVRKLEFEQEFKLKELQIKMEKEHEFRMRQLEIQKEKELRDIELQIEMKEKEIQAQREEREKRAEVDIRLKELEVEALKQVPQAFAKTDFDVSRQIRLVPPFQDKDVDRYFLHFEKVAHNLKWPKESWTLLLQSVLKGRAQEVYSALSIEQSTDYEIVKEVILKAYELVPEAYRQKFRQYKKLDSQTYVEFAREKEALLDRWCSSKEVNQNFGNLRQLILIEEFKRGLPGDLKTHLDEQKVSELHQAAILADDYALTHKSSYQRASNQFSEKRKFGVNKSQVTSSQNSMNQSGTGQGLVTKKESSVGSSQGPDFGSKNRCGYCRKYGHIMSNCWALQKKNKAQTTPNALAVGRLQVVNVPKQEKPKGKWPLSVDVIESYKPFVSEGFVSLVGDDNNVRPIRMLRDTGASQSLILEGVLPFSENTSTGASILVQGIECGFVNVPLHKLNLKSELASGIVTVGVRPTLPVEGVSFLLGNDLAGGKVVPVPQVTNEPGSSDTMLLEQKFPELFPDCAVTRAMARKQAQDETDENYFGLSDTFMAHSNVHSTPLEIDQGEVLGGGRTGLIAEQGKDPELIALGKKAVTEVEADTIPVCYFVKNGVLMRKWRPLNARADEEWRVVSQVVVPSLYRKEILALAHGSPMAGHLGVNKTCDRILHNFYWPGLRKDVAEYVKTCHTCQIVGKPNQKIPKAPLKPIPAFEEPFSRVIVDCVGPLPKSKSGNRFLLTIMCASTRFPEAMPLRNITAQVIIKALVKFFTKFGLPKTIQSDQGTNFMSGIFQQVMHELGIKQVKSSAYHPESQGALERFHQTLKTMIKTYCLDNGKDWDEGVPLLLFAVREVVQESLGFSPFELVFGHEVRGPLKMLKEHWLEEDTKYHLLDYVSSFKERLLKACSMAKENLAATQKKMKVWYDRKVCKRGFQRGDKVLVLLPVHGQPLQTEYYGPCVVDRKVSEVDYVVNTPGRRKQKQLCHINMLKKYYERTDESSVAVVASTVVGQEVLEAKSDSEESSMGDSEYGRSIKLQNSDVLANLSDKLCHLTAEEQAEMRNLILKYSHLFPDVPSRTDCVYHDVHVGDANPIKQHPYRVNQIKAKQMQKEIDYMLENNIIELSDSEWSSPCILVPKSDQTFRFCTDYRKVNSVTKTDSYPIPRVDDCIDQVGSASYVSKFDLLKGYWQVPLTEWAKRVSAFVTPNGLYQYKVMPFGMKNSAATFQRLINQVIKGLDGCAAYIDDIVICSSNWVQHRSQVEAFFERLSEAKLTVNLKKSEFGKAQVVFLGHVVGQGKVRPAQAKVEAILKYPMPTSKRELRRFLGMAGFYRKYCQNFADIASPLTDMLSKKKNFLWTEGCQKAFDQLKAVLTSSPVLVAPKLDQAFKLAVDASDIGAGAVLLQENVEGVDHPVSYYSKKFNRCQRNYSTIEKETLALVLALQHFEVYLGSAAGPVVVYTDHNPLTFLSKMKNKNQRLLRWSLFLQQFNLDIKHIKGKYNVIADSLSRVN